MVKSSEDSRKDMKVSDKITIGKTTYIVSSNAHLLDKKTIAEKVARVILNEANKMS